jgi:hypothetical protein
MKKTFICLIALTPVLAYSSNSLCSPDEAIVFSCLVGKKTISYCASTDLDENRGYMQYRFGTKEKIELVFPEAKVNPKGNFEIIYTRPMNDNGSRADALDINFNIGKFIYSLDYMDGAKEAAKLNVSRDGKSLAKLSCNSKSIQTDYISKMWSFTR